MPESVSRPIHYYRENVAKTLEFVAAFNEVADSPVAIEEALRRPGDTAGAYTRSTRAADRLGWRAGFAQRDKILTDLAGRP